MSLSPTNLTFSPMAIEVDCADFPVITALQQAQWRVNHPAFRTRCVLLACRASRVSLPPAQQPTNHATSPTARAFQTAQCPIRAVRCALRTVPADSEHDRVRSVPRRKHVRHRVLLRLPAHAQVHVPAGPVPCVRGPGATRGIQNAAARGTHRGTWRGRGAQWEYDMDGTLANHGAQLRPHDMCCATRDRQRPAARQRQAYGATIGT